MKLGNVWTYMPKPRGHVGVYGTASQMFLMSPWLYSSRNIQSYISDSSSVQTERLHQREDFYGSMQEHLDILWWICVFFRQNPTTCSRLAQLVIYLYELQEFNLFPAVQLPTPLKCRNKIRDGGKRQTRSGFREEYFSFPVINVWVWSLQKEERWVSSEQTWSSLAAAAAAAAQNVTTSRERDLSRKAANSRAEGAWTRPLRLESTVLQLHVGAAADMLVLQLPQSDELQPELNMFTDSHFIPTLVSVVELQAFNNRRGYKVEISKLYLIRVLRDETDFLRFYKPKM